MKRKLLVALGVVLAVSITACTPADDKDIDGDAQEEIIEEDAAEVEEDMDEDSDAKDVEDKEEIPEKGSDQEVSKQWPEDFMPNAPKLEGEIYVAKEEGPNKYFLEYKDIDKDEAVNYISSLKEAGFTKNVNEEDSTHIVKYKGMDKENNLIVFIWKPSEITKLELIKKNN